MLFLGTGSPYFVVESITMPSTTNFQLTFGGSYSKRNDDGSYDNTFDVAKLHVSLSADGTNWNEITYTKNNGDQDRPYWVFCTADFTLKSATDKLYIRYAADEASVYRLDDMTLKAGNGGQQVGYKNVDYFHKKFKKYVGVSPAEYRKQIGRAHV